MPGMPWSTGGIFQVTVITFVPFSYASLGFELHMLFHIYFFFLHIWGFCFKETLSAHKKSFAQMGQRGFLPKSSVLLWK